MALTPQNDSENYHLVVACVVDHPKAMALLRTARNRALDIGGRWRAVFIETPDHTARAEEGVQQRMLRLLTLAAQMGGETMHLHADSVEKGVLRVLEEEKERLTLLVTGDGQSERRLPRRQASSWDRAINAARKRHVVVEIVPLSEPNYRQTLRERLRWVQLHHVIYALMAVGLALLGAASLEHFLPPALFRVNNQNVGLLFMIACAFTAGRFGLLPGLVASGASFFIVNYYFTVPYRSFKFNNLTDTLNMMLFLSAALLISLFTSQTRGYAEKAAKRELNTQALFTLYRLAANASSRKQALEELQQKLTRMLLMDVAFFLPPALNPGAIMPAYPEEIALSEADQHALALCWKEMKTAGLASPFYPQAAWRFEPMIAPGGEIGVLGVRQQRKGQIDAWFGRLLTAIADQTATVLEHIELERSMEATRIREEREKLRSMLLSSVSHDLKTPLASIIGALNIYRSQGKKLSPEKQETLIETALEESERLDSFITNILDMTHLESGKIEFKQDWGDMHSVVQHVTRRLEHRLRQHRLHMHPSPKGIEVLMDIMMTEQVLQNVLDNACKYTPVGTTIEIHCSANEGSGYICEIRDHGGGLPTEKLDRVFDKYARLQKKDSQIAGTGLGLAICKAMMEAQGGSITAANHPEGGAVFTLQLPKWRKSDTTNYVA
jgi:two-component system sensor histidine kinase KdpD